MRTADDHEGCVIIISLILLIICVVIAALQPYFESRAYNRITGAQTTYWDALWLELRVQEAPRKP